MVLNMNKITFKVYFNALLYEYKRSFARSPFLLRRIRLSNSPKSLVLKS